MKQNPVKTDEVIGADDQLKVVKPKPELTEEAKEERALLAGMLIQQTDDRAELELQRKKRREEEIFELRSGAKISLAELDAVVSANRQPYEPKFPRTIPFFREIYRLNGWTVSNADKYTKPGIVGRWIREIIYGRFGKEVLPALEVLNPYLSNGLRLHKLFQFLTPQAQEKLIHFRDQAIALMKTCATWDEFRKKLFAEYKVPYQLSAFEKND